MEVTVSYYGLAYSPVAVEPFTVDIYDDPCQIEQLTLDPKVLDGLPSFYYVGYPAITFNLDKKFISSSLANCTF